ncbi:MAG: ATP-binding protein [Coriobacteriaceae bacterium]|jgi:hypothetical protein|nr:ATP-binding protein [Coriobacteriaceae bacterium]
MANPFTPSFGRVPPILAGREFVLNDIEQALENGGGDPNLCTLYIGPRGVGKTALMQHVAQIAGSYGWVSASTTTSPGMLEDLFEQATMAANQFVSGEHSARLTSIGVPALFTAEWEYRDPDSGNWRTRMGKLLDKLAEQDIGLLMTVDEVESGVDELIQLVMVFQHFISEGRKVALLMAGLPHRASALVSHDSVSFLRRAVHQHLGLISDEDVSLALRETVEGAGKTIDDAALLNATKAIMGFPYMMQLVGFRMWAASGEKPAITRKHVMDGAERARIDFNNGVLDATFKSLSAQDRVFLLAMLKDEGESLLVDIAERMGRKPGYARTYKERLLQQGVIVETDRNVVCFSMPFLREYLEAL